MKRGLLKSIELTLRITAMLSFSNSVSAETVPYKIKNGDTLYSIAKKYNTTVDTLKKIEWIQNRHNQCRQNNDYQ